MWERTTLNSSAALGIPRRLQIAVTWHIIADAARRVFELLLQSLVAEASEGKWLLLLVDDPSQKASEQDVPQHKDSLPCKVLGSSPSACWLLVGKRNGKVKMEMET